MRHEKKKLSKARAKAKKAKTPSERARAAKKVKKEGDDDSDLEHFFGKSSCDGPRADHDVCTSGTLWLRS